MKYTYGWVGSAVSSWADKQAEVIHRAAISRDIERKTELIQSGELSDYGPLDVMHIHDLTIGSCIFRAQIENTNSEIDAGFINPEFNALAEKMLGKTFTMSHESYVIAKALGFKAKIGGKIAKAIMASLLREFVEIDTMRFTVAVPGLEANSVTAFKVIKITELEAMTGELAGEFDAVAGAFKPGP